METILAFFTFSAFVVVGLCLNILFFGKGYDDGDKKGATAILLFALCWILAYYTT